MEATKAAAPKPEVLEQDTDILEELIARGGQRVGDTLAGLSMASFERSYEQHRNRVEASFKLTYPEDWVLYKTQDDKLLGYLQQDGCERIAGLWEIGFDKLNLREDVLAEEVGTVDERQVAYTVQVSGTCRVTGARGDELGFRSTADGFFKKQWDNARNEPAEQLRLLANVRKSAVENAKGRLTRSFTGMATVPVEELERMGLDRKRMRGVTFERGTQGGKGSMASEPQLKKLAGLACYEGKVAKVAKGDYGNVLRRLQADCTLSARAASDLIQRLSGLSEPMVNTDFWREAGYKPPAPPQATPPSGGPAPAGPAQQPPSADNQQGRGEEESVLDEKGRCRACERVVAEFGHSKSCPNAEPPA